MGRSYPLQIDFFREDSDDGDEHKHLKTVLDNDDLHASEELVVRRDVSNSDRIGLNIVRTLYKLIFLGRTVMTVMSISTLRQCLTTATSMLARNSWLGGTSATVIGLG
jgi:hypothetical protein